MNTTDSIWVPSYYRRPHRLAWVRTAAGPQLADCIAGAVFAGVVLALLLTHTAQHQRVAASPPAAAMAPATDRDTNADRVAYVARFPTGRK
jgi:hypothetical protein